MASIYKNRITYEIFYYIVTNYLSIIWYIYRILSVIRLQNKHTNYDECSKDVFPVIRHLVKMKAISQT